MGNRAGEAEFHEPVPPWTVMEGGRGRERRPGPPGASPQEEAPHEPSSKQAGFLVSIEPAPLPGDWSIRQAEARMLAVRFLARQALATRNSTPLRKAA